MALNITDILGLQGLTTGQGAENLIAAYGNDYHIWNPVLNSWDGQGIITAELTKVRSTVFLDKAFFVNGNNNNVRRYDGVLELWQDETAVKKAPMAEDVKQVGDRVYYAGVYFNNLNFRSKVWYSDLPKNNDLTYGLEYGTDLTQIEGSAYVRSASSYFKARNIKVGDPFFISTGGNIGEYNVQSIEDEKTIVLTEQLKTTVMGSNFWVGGNYVDVNTNDGDALTGIGENRGRKLFFKKHALYVYNDVSLKPIDGVPGTSSRDTIVNIGSYTYYFNQYGIWRTDGANSILISRSLQEYLDGIPATFFDETIAWKAGPSLEKYRVFVGDISNINADIEIERCYLEFDTITEECSVGQLPFYPTARTIFSETKLEKVFLGNTDSEIHQTDVGNDDNGDAIPFMAETGWHFPAGAENEIIITKAEVHCREGSGISFQYKLYGTPNTQEKQWHGLTDVKDTVTTIDLTGRENNNIGRGINIQFKSNDIDKPPIIERIDIIWRPITKRKIDNE